jgi:hypothetical protein
MKKFVVLLVVVALTCISSMAFAATEMAVTGQIDIRGRNLDNLDMNSDAVDTNGGAYTQERVRLNVDAKVGDTKGRISIENDWDTWGRFEAYQADASTGTFLRLREAWINFNLPGAPVNVGVGHQLLQLGQGWFFRSMKYGSDAWVLANVTGNNTAAFVNVKFAENTKTLSDDMDAYVILDMIKLSDTATVGIDVTDLKARSGPTKVDLQNIGLNYTGKAGPVALKAELDLQMGKVTTDSGATSSDNKFKGNQLVIEGKVPMDAVTVNFTVARGSGTDTTSTSTDISMMQTALDANQHYTFMYEYILAGPGGLHSGFAGTTALNVGASFAASKSLSVSADLWVLSSTEDVADLSTGAAANATTTSLGNELDVQANWMVADNLTWTWTLGYFMPGAGMGNDTATGIQQMLSYKF